jgi:hypothetical protein
MLGFFLLFHFMLYYRLLYVKRVEIVRIFNKIKIEILIFDIENITKINLLKNLIRIFLLKMYYQEIYFIFETKILMIHY